MWSRGQGLVSPQASIQQRRKVKDPTTLSEARSGWGGGAQCGGDESTTTRGGAVQEPWTVDRLSAMGACVGTADNVHKSHDAADNHD